MHQLCGYAAGLSIGLQINIEIRVAVEGGLCHCLFDDIRHLEEATLALAETGIHNLVGCIHDARHVTTFLNGIEGKLETLELLVVWLEELQVLSLEEVETVAIEMQTLWEGEGILDRQAHIRHAQLSLYRSIGKLHGTMHDALRMNQHLYLLGRNAKEPLCLCHLKTLVHQGCGIDGNLGTHIPGRMLEGIGSSYLLQLLVGKVAERTARAGEER